MYERCTLSHEAASRIMRAVLNDTHYQNGVPASIACAIVGSLGELIAFGAQDGCGALPRKLAPRKAYTSLILRRTTTEVKDAVTAGQIDMDRLNDAELAPMPGGAPLLLNGVIVGAIGVSGLPPAADAAIAEAAASEFNVSARAAASK
jgi:glc operon protein GlcG